MPSFPIQFARGTVPPEGPQVRASLDTRTGESALWDQVSNLGLAAMNDALADVKAKAREAEDVIAVAQGKARTDGLIDAFNKATALESDPLVLGEMLDELQGRLMESSRDSEKVTVYTIGRFSALKTDTGTKSTLRHVKELKEKEETND